MVSDPHNHRQLYRDGTGKHRYWPQLWGNKKQNKTAQANIQEQSNRRKNSSSSSSSWPTSLDSLASLLKAIQDQDSNKVRCALETLKHQLIEGKNKLNIVKVGGAGGPIIIMKAMALHKEAGIDNLGSWALGHLSQHPLLCNLIMTMPYSESSLPKIFSHKTICIN